MKIKKILLVVLACCIMALTSCNKKPVPTPGHETGAESDHVHKYEESWIYNNTHHWHECVGCVEKADYAEHSWTSSLTVKEATKTEEGIVIKTCECGYTKVEKIDKLNPFEAVEIMRVLNLSDFEGDDEVTQEEVDDINNWMKIQTSESFDAKRDIEYGFRFDKLEDTEEIGHYGINVCTFSPLKGQEYIEYSNIKNIEIYSANDLTKPMDISFSYKDYNNIEYCLYESNSLSNGTYYLFVTFIDNYNDIRVMASYVD